MGDQQAFEFLSGESLYRRVVLERMANARESVLISTANVKAMLVEVNGRFKPIADVFVAQARRGVSVPIGQGPEKKKKARQGSGVVLGRSRRLSR